MNILINREVLLEELNKVSKIISPKTNIPALAGVLINANQEGLTLITSDGSTSMRSEISIGNNLTVNHVGTILIKGRFLIDVVRKIEDEFITITLIDNTNIRVEAHNFSSVMSIMGVDDYPVINFQIIGTTIDFSPMVLKEAIDQTAFAIGERDKRMVLTGLNVKTIDNKLIFTATDSYRLSHCTITDGVVASDNVDLIIPGKFISDIEKLINENQSVIKMILNNTTISFMIDNCVIQSKVIEGKYPDTTKVVPAAFDTEITIKTRELIKVIERVSVLSNDPWSTIINLKTANAKLYLSSHTYEIGNAEEQIENFGISGPDQKIAFNARYILDALKAFKTEEVTLKIINETKPMVIVAKKNPGLFQLILPVRIF